jgi:tetratricopeptide (TPR) repeat protein
MRYASAAQYSEKIPTSNRALNRPNLEAFASFLEQRRQRFRRLSRILADSGVPLLVGTDTEIFGFPGHSAYLELLELREAGLTPFQVLASATRSAGDLLASSGQATAQERTGRIAAGYRADLLLLDQNPLEDIRHVRTIRGVMARGRWYSIGRITAMRDSVAARNTPRRAFVATFDSTLVKARNPRAAAQMLRQFLAENPTAVPFAELVWRGYGRLRFSDDTTSSIAIRRAMTEALPQSLLAWSELARGLLASGDTAGALQAFDRSLALSPRNSSVRDTDEKVKAKRSGSPESAVGTYRFETFTSRGKQYAPTVAITRTAVAYGGTMQINGASPVGLTELVVGRDQIWATAAIDGRDLELRFDRRSLMGSWVHGFVTNGTLRGVRGTGATPRHSSTSQTSSGSFRP